MKKFFSLVFFIMFTSLAFTQQFSEAIEDNSFFIEEAYNQDPGVVQHILNSLYDQSTKDIVTTFTQEWPFPSQLHQVSYTLSYLSLGGGAKGIGDILLNYRYQLWDDKNWAWIAPRFSLLLPTGKASQGLGDDEFGYQLCIPASKRWSNEFVVHLNAGVTLLPDKKETFGATEYKKSLLSYFVGASGILLLNEHLNIMLEALFNYDAEIQSSGAVEYTGTAILSPGIRYAVNIGELQIVPGIAVPIQFQSSSTTLQVFGYLSFEHPF
ncbi:MAG: transporter [Bacteroidetes bacterium]|nr:transporter [Bacteroidota bacterium]